MGCSACTRPLYPPRGHRGEAEGRAWAAANGTEINCGQDTECTFSLLARADPAQEDKDVLWAPGPAGPGMCSACSYKEPADCRSGSFPGSLQGSREVLRTEGARKALRGRRAKAQLSVIRGGGREAGPSVGPPEPWRRSVAPESGSQACSFSPVRSCSETWQIPSESQPAFPPRP